jgi:hypothetical protein
MSTLGYAIQRTVRNKVVRGYLSHVAEHDRKVESNRMFSFGYFRRVTNFRAFEHLRDVAERLEHGADGYPQKWWDIRRR